MVFQLSISERIVFVGIYCIYVDQSGEGHPRAPFRHIPADDYAGRSKRKDQTDSARMLAYRDAYAMIFTASGGGVVSACGDLTVLSSLDADGYIDYDANSNSISLGDKALASSRFSLEHSDDNGNRYQAVIAEK